MRGKLDVGTAVGGIAEGGVGVGEMSGKWATDSSAEPAAKMKARIFSISAINVRLESDVVNARSNIWKRKFTSSKPKITNRIQNTKTTPIRRFGNAYG